MRNTLASFASIVALLTVSEAAAGPGHCYDRFGRPIGGVYDTDRPDYNWLNWVKARGGICRGISHGEADQLRGRGVVYPPDYRVSPGYAPPPSYTPPPSYPPPPPVTYTPPAPEWYGDLGHAQQLIQQWYWRNGRPNAWVRDRGELINAYDRIWRVFSVGWPDGARIRVAVRQRRVDGSYLALQSYDRVNWSEPFPLGY